MFEEREGGKGSRDQREVVMESNVGEVKPESAEIWEGSVPRLFRQVDVEIDFEEGEQIGCNNFVRKEV